MSKASPAASSSVGAEKLRLPGHVDHGEELRVTAAGEQADERRLDRLAPEGERGDVAAQVVDRDERQLPRPGERLRRRDADEQRSDEPRALRHRDALDVVERSLRPARAPRGRPAPMSSRWRREATSGTTPP